MNFSFLNFFKIIGGFFPARKLNKSLRALTDG